MHAHTVRPVLPRVYNISIGIRYNIIITRGRPKCHINIIHMQYTCTSIIIIIMKKKTIGDTTDRRSLITIISSRIQIYTHTHNRLFIISTTGTKDVRVANGSAYTRAVQRVCTLYICVFSFVSYVFLLSFTL